MSNRIDFFQPQNSQLAVGANTVNVYLDGQFCDFLVPEKITYAAEPEFNQAILNYYPLRDSSLRCAPFRMTENVTCGQRIVIKTVYDGGIGISCPDELVIFAGFVEQIETSISTTIIAKDYSARLKRKTVYGKNIYSNGQSIFIASENAVFNPSGKPNMSRQQILFAADENNANLFTCADAIYYLLQNYIPAGEIVIPTLEQLNNLTRQQSIIDVDVTGLNLIDALIRCCKQSGLRFKFAASLNGNSPLEAIVFFRPENCRAVELNCQWSGERIDISKTNIVEASRKKNTTVTHRYIVQGDYKIYEATFELVKGWDPALELNDYDRYSPLTNENFNEVRDVYRKWCLNEAGDYSASPYNQGAAFDFSKIFENGTYIRRKSRFLPALTCGDDGSSIGYNLEVSYTNGSHWWPYMNSYKVLLDQCGIWLSIEQLDRDMWFAILKEVLKVRITASVMADERISFTAADGPVNSTVDVIDKIVTLPRRFKYQKVSPYSIFKPTQPTQPGKANQIDDTQSVVELANSLCESGRSINEQMQIKTLVLSPIYSPGDRIICSPDSSDILGVKYDNRSLCWIEKVQMDFTNQQTILTAFKKRT